MVRLKPALKTIPHFRVEPRKYKSKKGDLLHRKKSKTVCSSLGKFFRGFGQIEHDTRGDC